MQAPSSESMSLQEKRKLLQDKARALGDQIHVVSRSRSSSIDDSMVMTSAGDDSSAMPLEKLSLEERLTAAHNEVAVLREQTHRAATVEAELRQEKSELKAELLASQEETIVLQTLNEVLESKNAVLKDQVVQTEVTLNKSYNDTLDGLTSHIEALESHSKDLQAENDALRARNEALVASEKSRLVAADASLVEPETEQLRQDFTAVLARVQAVERENKELLAHHLVQENQDLKNKLANLESTLNESYNENLLAFTKALQETEDQVKSLQKERDQLRHEVAVAKLKGMKSGGSGNEDSNSLNTTEDIALKQENDDLMQENADLKQETEDIKQQLQSLETTHNKSYNDTLSSLTSALKESETQVKELVTERDALRFQTTEATRLTHFLQEKCEKLMASSQQDAARWEEQVQSLQSRISELEFQNTGASRVTQFLETRCQKLVDDLSEAKQAHESVNSDLHFQLTEAQRVSKFLQSKCEQLVQAQQQRPTVVADQTSIVTSEDAKDGDESTASSEEQVEALRAAPVSNRGCMVEEVEKEVYAETLCQDNENSPALNTSLQEQNLQLEECIVQLKEQAQQSEMTLNKSHVETLDGFTAHIAQLEERIRELEEEQEDEADPMEDHAKQLAELQTRVESTKRANKFLREQLDKNDFYTELEAVKRDKRYLEGRVSSLEEQNTRLKEDIERYERGEWEYCEDQHTEEDQEEGEVPENSEVKSVSVSPRTNIHPQFKDLGDDDSDSSSSEAEEDPMSVLKRRNLDLTTKIHQLKLETEQLTTSKNEQIEDLTDKVGMLETRVQTLHTENDELNQVIVEAYAAMEFRQKKIDKEAKLRKFLERKLETILEEKKAAELANDDLTFQLTEARRISDLFEEIGRAHV